MRRARAAVAAASLAAALHAAAQGAPGPDPSVLRVAMSGSYPPLHDEVQGGFTGLEPDLAMAIGHLLQRRVVFVSRKDTGTSAIEAVAAGKADVALSAITPTEERRALVDFTKPYLVLRYRVAARADAIEPGGTAPVRGRKVAVPRGPAFAAARALLPGAKLVEAPSVEKAIQLVADGKAQLAFGEDVGIAGVLSGTGIGVFVVNPPLGESPIAMAVPKGEAARWDAELARHEDRLKQLVQGYEPGALRGADVPPTIHVHLGKNPSDVYELHLDGGWLDGHGTPDASELSWQEVGDGAEVALAAEIGVGLPKALARRATGELKRPSKVPWARLEDGTVVAFERWRKSDEEGWRVATFRHGAAKVERVVTFAGD